MTSSSAIVFSVLSQFTCKHCLQLTFREAVVADMHVDGDRNEQSLLSSPGHSCYAPTHAIETQLTRTAESAQAVCRCQVFLPRVNTRIQASPHYHTLVPLGMVARGIPLSVRGSPSSSAACCSKDLTVTRFYNRPPHTTQTQFNWNMRHTICGAVY